jgi:hypothetical protein
LQTTLARPPRIGHRLVSESGDFEGMEMICPPVIVIASECVRRGFDEY